MIPAIATALFTAGILGLFYLNRDSSIRTSKALWVPTIWVLIIGSRAPSMWFQSPTQGSAADAYLEGSPFERILFSGLLVLAILVLLGRWRIVLKYLRNNGPILLFIGYCALSLVWADYPDVGFKRWTKLVADFAMVLIVATDAEPIAAFNRLISRVGFLIVPISILFIRYFPGLGRNYDTWSGEVHWTGVASNKNALGMICMIIGLGELWQFVQRYQGVKGRQRTRALIAHGVIVAMVIYLLREADSATSTSCFALGGFVILAISFLRLVRKPIAVHMLAIGVMAIAAGTAFFNFGGLVHQLGRNADLTGRTELWSIVLSQPVSRVFGTGYENFWLGDRLATVERLSGQLPNQAHDGYIEILINLGWMGISFLALVIVTGYWKITRGIRQDASTNSLRLAYFVAAIIYNFTEAAFKMTDPVWICFVWAIVSAGSIAMPDQRSERIGTDLDRNRVAPVPKVVPALAGSNVVRGQGTTPLTRVPGFRSFRESQDLSTSSASGPGFKRLHFGKTRT